MAAFKCPLAVFLLFLLVVMPTKTCLAANEIYAMLVEQGLEISPSETIKLPTPILADGIDSREQRQAIEKLLANRYDWENFTRKSVVSPFLLKIAESEPGSKQVGRRIDVYFVTFGSLAKLSSDGYLDDQLNMAATASRDANDGGIRVLSDDDLGKRGLPASQGPGGPRWVAVETTLLGKVRISLTTRNVKTVWNDSVLIASALDQRFQSDAEYPNSWQSISIDDLGRRQMGPPHPYNGLGFYAKATELVEPPGAIFVEYHIAYAEPQGWFRGANLLRSKLPIVTQDLVRKLRRNMNEQ